MDQMTDNLYWFVLIIVAILFGGIYLYNRRMNLNRDKVTDYKIDWDTINSLDIADVTNNSNFNDDLTLAIDFGTLSQFPNKKEAIKRFLHENREHFKWGEGTNLYDYYIYKSEERTQINPNNLKRVYYMLHCGKKIDLATPVNNIQNVTNYGNNNITFNNYNEQISNIENQLDAQNYLTPNDLSLIRQFLDNAKQGNATESEKSNIIGTLATYGELAASLAELFKAFVL